MIDLQRLQASYADPRDPTIPFAGSWMSHSFPPDLLAVPDRLIELERWSEALEYLVDHVPTDKFVAPITKEAVLSRLLTIGRQFALLFLLQLWV